MRILRLVAALFIAAVAPFASAGVIDVLWTSGTTAYNNNIQELASEAPGFDPNNDGSNSWNVTFWNPSDPVPVFSDYDALVIGSTSNGGNFFGLGVSAAGVLANKAAIEAARGSRTFLSGQDADYHDLYNVPDKDDGPKGFLINAVNWAAAGTGLGIVSLTDGWTTSEPNGWWKHNDSFLKDELSGVTRDFGGDQTVYIGTGQESFPINEGLTSAGLSYWNTSSHLFLSDATALDDAGYVAINFEGPSSTGRAITIVTKGQETGTTVPAPAPLGLLMIGLFGLWMRSRCA